MSKLCRRWPTPELCVPALERAQAILTGSERARTLVSGSSLSQGGRYQRFRVLGGGKVGDRMQTS